MQLGFQWYTWAMKPPMVVRPLTDEERLQLEADRRTGDACRVRRAPIVLASARGLSPQPLAPRVGCAVHTVRHVSHALHTRGVEGVAKPAQRPTTANPVLDAPAWDRLQPRRHQAPRR
jgi:hypothetical protein